MSAVQAKFIGSYGDFSQCPSDAVNEVAIIGRSNVGKSSLLNALTGQNHLAKVSGKPGKTQTINLFDMGTWRFADLPGYGYAKVSKKMRESWKGLVWNYLRQRPNLFLALVLVDVRLPPQEIDMNFINSLGEEGIPWALVFTKADKLTKNQAKKALGYYAKALQSHWEELPPQFLTSASSKEGVEKLLSYLEEIQSEHE